MTSYVKKYVQHYNMFTFVRVMELVDIRDFDNL